MKKRIIHWLELDKGNPFEFNLNCLKRLGKLLPMIAGSIFLYLFLSSIGGQTEQPIITGLTSTVPIICYAIWVLMLFIVFSKPRKDSNKQPE